MFNINARSYTNKNGCKYLLAFVNLREQVVIVASGSFRMSEMGNSCKRRMYDRLCVPSIQ